MPNPFGLGRARLSDKASFVASDESESDSDKKRASDKLTDPQKRSTHAFMPKDTRTRILVTARRLFNADGFGNVTTATLASAVGIAQGNLWYHFKSKRDLLEAISADFIAHIQERLRIGPVQGTDVVDAYIRWLEAFATELREYRFLYRDQADYGEHSDIVLAHLPDLYSDSQAQLKQFYASMIEQDLLDWPEERLDDLATNAIIIIRFGLEYLRETQQAVADGSGAVRQTFLQHLTLLEHRLKPEAATRIRAALSAPAADQAQ